MWYFQAIIDNMALQYDEFTYGGVRNLFFSFFQRPKVSFPSFGQWYADMEDDIIDFDSDGGDFLPVGGIFNIVSDLFQQIQPLTVLGAVVTDIVREENSSVVHVRPALSRPLFSSLGR